MKLSLPEFFASLVSATTVERIGWLLVHSLWQFAAIAMVVLFLGRILNRRSAALRYATLLAGLLMMVTTAFVTWIMLPESLEINSQPDLSFVEAAPADLTSDGAGMNGTLPTLTPPTVGPGPDKTVGAVATSAILTSEATLDVEAWQDRLTTILNPWLTTIVGIWCCGVVLFSLRPMVSWVNVHRLTTTGVTPVSSSVKVAFDRVQQRLKIVRPVQVLQSIVVNSPIVVGCFRSTILLPASFISSVPVSQLEAILAHELAHVQRYDYLVNLLQTLVETLFFYHPAVWWISNRIRDERENCCDDLVVAAMGNKIEYGRALLAVEQFRSAATSSLALSAKGGSLLTRVKRLFADPVQDNSNSSGLAAIGILLAMITAAGTWTTVIAVADENSLDSDSEQTSLFVVKITDEISVELVAVLPHNADVSKAWKPNGLPLKETREIPTFSDLNNRFDNESRQFVVQLKGTTGADVTFRVSGLRSYLNPDENGFTCILAEPTAIGKKMPLRVGVADLNWGPWLKVDTRTVQPIEQSDIPEAYRDVYEQIQPDHVERLPRACVFCWDSLTGMDERCQWSVVAVHKNGNRLEHSGKSAWRSGKNGFAAEIFSLPIENIDHFEYRLRPFRHWVTFENVSLEAGQKTNVKMTTVSIPISEDAAEFGPESHGLQFRLVALSPDVNDNAPDLKSVRNDWTRSTDMTFGVELKNVSSESLTLVGVREHDATETQSTLRTTRDAPHWFDFEFTDLDGKPIPRTHQEFYHQSGVAYIASTHELAPGQSLVEILRPAKFMTPMEYDLPPGKYRVRVHYHGSDDSLRAYVRSNRLPEKAILNAWPHDVVSNSVEFEVKEASRRSKPEDLVWGQPVDGLQAAIEFRVPDDVTGNPLVAPGVTVGTPIVVMFHLRNVSDKSITFLSETCRQGDFVHVMNERGEKVEVKDAFYTGWPIDVEWKLEPGEMARLQLLTPNLKSLDQPERFTVRYTIRFNSRSMKDEAGNVTFPRPGDYDKEVDTGDTPLFLAPANVSRAE